MRLALALLFLLSAFTGFAQAQKQASLWRTALFEPRKLPETIIEKAAKLQVGMDLKFLSLEAFEGAGIADTNLHSPTCSVESFRCMFSGPRKTKSDCGYSLYIARIIESFVVTLMWA